MKRSIFISILHIKYWFAVLFLLIIFIYAGNYLINVDNNDLSTLKNSGSISELIQNVNSYVDTKTFNKEKLVEINGLFLRLIGKDIVEDANPAYDTYKLKNGQLSFTYPEMDVTVAIENMAKLNDFCNDQDISLLFYQLPYKVNKYDNQLPDQYKDGSNINADKFLMGLQKNQVHYVDYREAIRNFNSEVHEHLYFKTLNDYSELFFDGDHHWNEGAAFDAYVYLLHYMKNIYKYECNETYADINQFECTTYSNAFIGSQLYRVKRYYADALDDFTAIIPRNEGYFTRFIYDSEGNLKKTNEGNFQSAVLRMSLLEENSFPRTAVDNLYLGHNPAVDVIVNHDILNEEELLILEDSFSRPISAYMSLNFSKVHIMDKRYYNKSVIEYIKANRGIKYVVVSYPPTCFKETTYGPLFDF